jgi:hypothetical protein
VGLESNEVGEAAPITKPTIYVVNDHRNSNKLVTADPGAGVMITIFGNFGP